jgi:simple sugar transport system ATP-binding protein
VCSSDLLEDRFGLTAPHDKKIYNMSVSEKQTVEILKMLYRGATALILDEPTAVLAPQEIERLFSMLRNMKQEGCAVVIITHKLNEVMEISDRVTVMRKGRVVETVKTADTNPRELTKMMVGASVSLEIKRDKPAGRDTPLLEIRNLGSLGAQGEPVLDGVDFCLYGGEILGVAGIAGSGQKELCEIIAGLRKKDAGDVLFQGESVSGLSPGQIRDRGLSFGFVPEDRLGMGLAGGMSVSGNVLLRSYKNQPGIFVDYAAADILAEQIVKRYDVSTPSIHQIIRKLSGGNIQKVMLGREIDLSPRVLITAYPVRGLDVSASYFVYDLLNEQKKQGVAVLYIGEDLDVLMELCDRLMVIHNGKVMGIVDPHEASKELIGLMMLGEKPEAREGNPP